MMQQIYEQWEIIVSEYESKQCRRKRLHMAGNEGLCGHRVAAVDRLWWSHVLVRDITTVCRVWHGLLTRREQKNGKNMRLINGISLGSQICHIVADKFALKLWGKKQQAQIKLSNTHLPSISICFIRLFVQLHYFLFKIVIRVG